MSPTNLEIKYNNHREKRDALPVGFSHRVTDVNTADEYFNNVASLFQCKKLGMMPVLRLSQPKTLKLRKPLQIHFFETEDIYVAENETLRLYGMGETPEAALQELIEHLLHFHCYYLKVDWALLTKDAAEFKTIYQDLFDE